MKHVLVIRLSALGDVAIMVPLVERYASANPNLHFTVAGPPLLQPLFEGMPNVEYLGLKKKQSFIKIYHTLHAVGADTVVDLHKVNRVGFALTLLRLRHLLDFHFRIHALRKGKLSRWLFLHHLRKTPRRSQYLRYDDVFRRAGLKKMESGKCKVESRLPRQGNFHFSIGIAPFAQHQGKIWPHEYTQQLIKLLADRGYQVLLFGSKEEAPLLESWTHLEPSLVTSVAGKQTFREELDIIKSLTLMVSMDSANMHFASALGVPVVSIWGATHPDFGFYPYNQQRSNALCANLPCQPCSAFGNRPCRFGDYRCLHAVTPQGVLEKIIALTGQSLQ
ncbi:MAG: glycosyltransferase family 9 protein [Bacteroidales bacterium]|nr:glycosyltransferase family 9 protein [Bacteroidales bacterium]